MSMVQLIRLSLTGVFADELQSKGWAALSLVRLEVARAQEHVQTT